MASFHQLQQSHSLPASHFFRYLQIRNYVRSHIAGYEHKPINTILSCLIRHNANSKGSISFLYSLLLPHVTLSDTKIKKAWEEELGVEITDDTWSAILAMISKSSINSRHRLIQFKIVHRLHYTKSRLHTVYPNISPLCDKCKQDTGTLLHQLWLCPKLHAFWSLIFDYISKAYEKPIGPDQFLALFGLSVTSTLDNHVVQAISLCTLLAKRLILQQWKSEVIPTFHQWLRELGNVIHMESLRYKLANQERVFLKVWKPLLDKWSVTQQS